MRTSVFINKEVLNKILNECKKDQRSFSNLISLLAKANGQNQIEDRNTDNCVLKSIYINEETEKIFNFHMQKGMTRSGIVRSLCSDFIDTVESYD